MADYLIEESLGAFLEKVFNAKFIHNKALIGKFKPDYRNDELKLVVEFDGWQHYTSAMYILRDHYKDGKEMEIGYNVVRWPYFVQMSTQSIKDLLHVDYDVPQTYPHGFVDSKCVLPADFCSLGVEKFKKDLEMVDESIRQDIISSLKAKAKDARFGKEEVMPLPLMDLIER